MRWFNLQSESFGCLYGPCARDHSTTISNGSLSIIPIKKRNQAGHFICCTIRTLDYAILPLRRRCSPLNNICTSILLCSFFHFLNSPCIIYIYIYIVLNFFSCLPKSKPSSFGQNDFAIILNILFKNEIS